MRQEVKDALEGLAKLDLSSLPYNEAKKLISQLRKFGCIIQTLHAGKSIMRARPNYKGERFMSRSQLSYKPQQFNTTFQRASTPNATVFYGSTVPENLQPGELENTRVIGAFEALPWLRDPNTKGYQKISFGRWIVKKDIHLVAMVYHENFYKESSYTRELVDNFKAFTKKYPQMEEETLAIADFFAKEFAKENTDPHYHYLLSASFTETVIDKGLDGVFYPSVRVGGKGFNVAIKPEKTDDTYLELVVAGECSIYKHYKNTIVDNETIVEVKPGQTDFEFLPVDPKHRFGEEECLRRLGLKSMKDLTE